MKRDSQATIENGQDRDIEVSSQGSRAARGLEADVQVQASFPQAYASALRTARIRARQAVIAGQVPWFERDDLEQEGLIACWRALPKFDPKRASLQTFIELVIASRLASVHRARRCRLRFEPLEAHEDRAGDNSWARNIELRTDVRRVLATLEDGDRRIALALIDYSPTEVSRELGVARSTVYTSISRIREAFQLAGLGPRSRFGDVHTVAAREEA
jgi:RNA polymerase sigma factor (sigma-70 family)